MMSVLVVLLLLLLIVDIVVSLKDSETVYKSSQAIVVNDNMPLPFTRVLKVTNPLMYGTDVLIATTLLSRSTYVSKGYVPSNTYDEETSLAINKLQQFMKLDNNSMIDSSTASLLLNQYSNDGYKDNGIKAGTLGYLYKVLIPVYMNRSIETIATLYDKDNNILLTFTVRAHGHRDDGSSNAWPDFGDGDYGLNQFSSSGATVTGLIAIDLNSPEPDPNLYGPYPVNRFVRGIDGNAKLLLPHIRDGILIHTGNWSTSTQPWDPSMAMPDSSGCVHAHPDDIEKIYKALTKLGVVAHDNPYSGQNYPYEPQGIAVVQQMD